MSIIKTQLKIGETRPFQILHMADTHLTYADITDGQREDTGEQIIVDRITELYFKERRSARLL